MDWRARWAGSRSGARTAGRWLVGLALTVLAAALGLPYAVRAFARAVEVLLQGCVSLAVAVSAGASAWSVAGTIARSLAATIATPQATGGLAVLVVVAIGALWGLQRLLGPEQE